MVTNHLQEMPVNLPAKRPLALKAPPPRKRSSFARARKESVQKEIPQNKISLVSLYSSGLEWSGICEYFEEDVLLKPLRLKLLDDYSPEGFGELLYQIWLVCEEEQFSWFVGTFEETLAERMSAEFDQALEAFNKLCDAC